MKRYRGFKLGRKLATFWRWAFRRRHRGYLRLYSDPIPPQSQLKSPVRPLVRQKSRLYPKKSTISTKLFNWGKHLTRRFRSSAGEAALLTGKEEEEEAGCRPPPKGHLAVYVGGQRHLVPVIYFNHPLFGELLREAEEEFGFHHPGVITIPCAAARFERVQTRIKSSGVLCKRSHLSS
ncbi:auxin-responsive protein SAUR36 [Typha latifolia]|uniref:auxin-responsive protein SAUR36 n=1 Tax=Typha latifolia TaxID=4733 RepID=UPI003C2F55E6